MLGRSAVLVLAAAGLARAAGAPVEVEVRGVRLDPTTGSPVVKVVLISDVGDDAAAHEALRGDVITALDGKPVHSVGELTDRAGARPADGPVRLSLRRGVRDLTITFATR